MEVYGTKHLIECHCVLPQFRNSEPTIYHKVAVFSIIENDIIKEKLIQCNNCDVIHRIVDICKSEILRGNDSGLSIRKIDDIEISLPTKLSQYLKLQNIDFATWEQIEFILDNKLEEDVVIKRELHDLNVNLKIINFKSDGSFKVRNEVIFDTVDI